MKYCKACGQNVQPTKKFSIVWFLINCLWLVGGIVYVLYYLFGKSKVCPICCGNDLEAKRDIKDFTTDELGLSEKEQKQIKLDTWVKKVEASTARMKAHTAKMNLEKKQAKEAKAIKKAQKKVYKLAQ